MTMKEKLVDTGQYGVVHSVRMVCQSGQWTMVQWMTYWHISKASIFIRRILSEENAMDICKSSAMEDVTTDKVKLFNSPQ